MIEIIDKLEKLAENDSKVRAELRRSLSFDPGKYVKAFPYVERFLKKDISSWHREMYYLVAGLWASHSKQGNGGEKKPFEEACAEYNAAKASSSTETRFITLIDSDSSQLPHHLRQWIALLKGSSIDFTKLLKDILQWGSESKLTQIGWAKAFYKSNQKEDQTPFNSAQENI